MKAQLIQRSGNRKTGPMPVSITTEDTCPPTCGVREACYAKFHHLARHWRRVWEKGVEWVEFCKCVAALPTGVIWRHNEAGDLPGDGNTVDAKALHQLVSANQGKRGFTYTAKPVLGTGEIARNNRAAIARANAAGFVINLSAVSLADADAKARLRIAPVTVVLPSEVNSSVLTTPEGRKVDVCPHVFDARIQCWFCGLCAEKNRSVIVGFPAHGAGRKRIPFTTARLDSNASREGSLHAKDQG